MPFFFLLEGVPGAPEAGVDGAGALAGVPAGVEGFAGAAPSVPGSTRTASSSSLAGFPVDALSADSSSTSCRSSVSMVARRFSHHSFSSGVLLWMVSSFFRNWVFTAISFADWKMNWPQLDARPFAWLSLFSILARPMVDDC